jgi:hypothetical protein
VMCFDGEIRQVLSNIVGNAIEALHSFGERLLAQGPIPSAVGSSVRHKYCAPGKTCSSGTKGPEAHRYMSAGRHT